jgi:hypothetical protein
MHRDSEPLEGDDEAVVFALRSPEVDRSQKTVRGIVECPRERGSRPLHEDLA